MSDTEEPELTYIPEVYDDDDYDAFVIDLKVDLTEYTRYEGLPLLKRFNKTDWIKLLKELT